MVRSFDYIISGAGAAGLSILMRLMQHPSLANKTILVVDNDSKERNDRTWCFWEKEPGYFEPIVHHKWQQVYFHSHNYSSSIDLSPYHYKMIRGIDFYNYVLGEARSNANVTLMHNKVSAMGNEGNKAFIICDEEKIFADYVFNSIMFSPPNVAPTKHYLLQHFKGWMIETSDAIFDENIATLMDFRVSQHHGTTFCYVLPLSTNKALVEYTLFSKKLLEPNEYDDGLRNYITTFLKTTNYNVIENEFGVIPMTNHKFSKGEGRIVQMGTIGGQTKASSGYTFNFIQKHADALVQSLVKNGHPFLKKSLYPSRFSFYDTTFLNVLYTNKVEGEKIFTDMFSKNSVDKIFRFLDNESTLEDELNIMGSLPYLPFTKAAVQELLK